MRRPDVAGKGGGAWLVPLDRYEQWMETHAGSVAAQTQPTRALWYVNGDGFTPFFSWWAVGLVKLEERPGFPPPVLQYPGAEYELIMVDLDPTFGEPPVNGEGAWHGDTVQLAFQFHGVSEEQAKEITISAVEAICGGVMIPQPEHRAQWVEILTRIVNDYRAGKFGGLVQEELEQDPVTRKLTGATVERDDGD